MLYVERSLCVFTLHVSNENGCAGRSEVNLSSTRKCFLLFSWGFTPQCGTWSRQRVTTLDAAMRSSHQKFSPRLFGQEFTRRCWACRQTHGRRREAAGTIGHIAADGAPASCPTCGKPHDFLQGRLWLPRLHNPQSRNKRTETFRRSFRKPQFFGSQLPTTTSMEAYEANGSTRALWKEK